MKLVAIVLAIVAAALLMWVVARLLSEDESIGMPGGPDTEFDGEAWRW